MRALHLDLRDSRRELLRHPLTSAAVVALLALGLGIATAVAGALDVLWLRPLAFPDPERLVLLWETHPQQPAGWRLASATTVERWQEELESLSGLAVSQLWRPVLDGAVPRSLDGLRVSEGSLEVFGVVPALGRGFTHADHVPGAPPVVILSYSLWQSELGGDPGALGRTLHLAGPTVGPATLVGILPAAARLAPPAVAVPAAILAPLPATPGASPEGRYLQVLGRLRPDLPPEVARRRVRAELDVASRRLAATHPATHDAWRGSLESLAGAVVTTRREGLRVVAVAAATLLAVVWLDAAFLLLARAAARGRSQAVHLALGARPGDLGRRVFFESLFVAGLGGGVGLLGAAFVLPHGVPSGWLPELAGGWLAGGLPDGGGPTGGVSALLAGLLLPTVALTLLTAVAVAVLPVLHATRHRPGALLRGAGAAPAVRRWPAVLVVVQTAFAFVLLTTSALLARSLDRLTQVDPGLVPAHVLALRLRSVSGGGASAGPGEPLANRWRRALEEVSALPRVHAAALTSHLPMQGRGMSTNGSPEPAGGAPVRLDLLGVSHGYFRTLGVALHAGRDLRPVASPTDPGTKREVVINASAARALWPERVDATLGSAKDEAFTDVLGLRLRLDWMDPGPWEIVGVAADVRHVGLDAAARPTVYLPFPRLPHRALSLIARADAEPVELSATLRARLRSADRTLVVESARPLAEMIRDTLGPRRAAVRSVTGFAALALLLVTAAIAGVLAERVTRQRRELAIRSALGATPRRLASEVLLRGLRWSALGLAGGAALYATLTRLLAGLLFEVPATDPWAPLAAALILLATATAATAVAIRRVTRIDPADVLRSL